MLGQWGNQHRYQRMIPRQNGNSNNDNNNDNQNGNNNNGPDTSAFDIMNGRVFTPGLAIILAVRLRVD
jgi:hypothetical protein